MNKITVKPRSENTPQTAENFNQFKYLAHILECEKTEDILHRRLMEISRAKHSLSPNHYQSTNYYKESLKTKKLIPEKKYPKETKKNFQKSTESAEGLLAITFMGGGVISIIYGLKEMFSDVRYGLFKGLWIGIKSAFWLLVIFMVIAGIISIILLVTGKSKDKSENEKARAKVDAYNRDARKKNEIIKKENSRKSQECKLKFEEYWNKAKEKQDLLTPLLLEERKIVEEKLDECRKTLDMLYNLKIDDVWCLHPNYRGLSTVSILYGYFETGRCTQLQGHEGAYNLYEDEKIKGIIISKLDDISHMLDNLNSTMYYVGMSINDVNEKVRELSLESARTSENYLKQLNNINESNAEMKSTISSKLNAIEENTANTAYYSEIGAKAATYTAMYHYLNQ